MDTNSVSATFVSVLSNTTSQTGSHCNVQMCCWIHLHLAQHRKLKCGWWWHCTYSQYQLRWRASEPLSQRTSEYHQPPCLSISQMIYSSVFHGEKQVFVTEVIFARRHLVPPNSRKRKGIVIWSRLTAGSHPLMLLFMNFYGWHFQLGRSCWMRW